MLPIVLSLFFLACYCASTGWISAAWLALAVSWLLICPRELKELLWAGLAKILAWRPVRNWIIRRAFTGDWQLHSRIDGYMNRWWIFNGWGEDNKPKYPWLPSIRLNRIMREDRAEHYHDHPWTFRTIVLYGWYVERRQFTRGERYGDMFRRHAGQTAELPASKFHKIEQVSPGGCWTLFITWRRRCDWGFDVDGVKVLNRDYLGER